jgi:uroporphyrinogen-III synthase
MMIHILLMKAVAFLSMMVCPAHSFSYQHNTRANPLSPRDAKSLDVEMVAGDGLSSAKTTPLVVALTREEGKNDKLRRALLSGETLTSLRFSVEIHEIPCIEHADGPDTEMLVPTLTSKQFDYIAITSPEAAKVFASAWVEAGRPEIKGVVAAVGEATGEALKEYGIDVGFVPSKATAETLVNELPLSDAAKTEIRATTLLYPASAKAQDTLQNGLEERGFSVSRLNTYDTVPATWTAEQLSLAESAKVACFASPSAVKAWLKNTGTIGTPRAIAACIGETSASACGKNGWEESNIFYPEKPGVDGWASAVVEAVEFIDKQC